LIVLPDPAKAPLILPVIVPIVHVNVLAALAVKAIAGLVPLHVAAVLAVVTTGLGFTVTVIVYAAPGQLPVVDVGTTIYSTVPAVALLALVSTWLMVLPDPALAPVISAETVPSVHVKLLGALAVNDMFGLVPLQVAAVLAVVTSGVGLTVTVILYVGPVQVPVVDTGVIRYSTLPAVELLGFVRTSLIVAPPPANAPTMPPVLVPSVHVKLLGTLDVKAILVFVPLQILFTAELVTTGNGLTVTTTLVAVPTHPSGLDVGVTRYSTVPTAELLKFVSA
jgi:hypothetical protein